MKYKVVGVLDILLSSLFIVTQLGLVLFVYPKMLQMYSEFNVQLPLITRYFYLFSAIFVVFYIFVFIVGIILVKKQAQKLFIIGILMLILMLLFSGYFTAMSVLGVLIPLYGLMEY